MGTAGAHPRPGPASAGSVVPAIQSARIRRRGKIMKWKHVGRFQIMTVGLALSLVLLPGWRLARAEEPNYAKRDDFEKSKEEFGREKPPVDVRLGGKKEHHAKPAKERKTPAWLKGKTVGGWGGPTMNYLGLDLDVFEPLTEGRGLNEFHHDTWLIGGMGV